jgi:hypothetical protein
MNANPEQPGGTATTAPPPPPPPAAKPWYQENAAAVFSLAGVALTGFLTFQTHGIDGRLKAIEDKNALAQTFQQRVFDNVEKLLSQKQPQASRLYLIGLYGQARDDEQSKSLVASIAAASCSADLLRTLQALTTAESDDERRKLSALINIMSRSSTCLPAGDATASDHSQGSKPVAVTPPPETIAARSALVASLTPADAVGWIQIGTAPNGTEALDCIILDAAASSIVDVWSTDGKAISASILPQWGKRCPAEARAFAGAPKKALSRVVLPRNNQDLAGLKLHLRVDRTLYGDHLETSPVTGIAKADSIMSFVVPGKGDTSQSNAASPIKGMDVFDGGKKTYNVWAYVRIESAVGANFAAPAPSASAAILSKPTASP